MSESGTPEAQPTQPQQSEPPVRTVDFGSPKSPTLRLPVWVVVALILILFSSCSAANNARNAADAAERATGGSGSVASAEEMQAMCRLLGAVATKEGIDVSTVFADGSSSGTQCQEEALAAARP